MEKLKEFLGKYGIYFLIFLLALSLRITAISQKHYMFYDSPFSIMMSTPNNLSPEGKTFKKRWDKYSLQTGKNYTLKEFKQALFKNEANLKSIINDWGTLRNNDKDTSHSNLYYSILRLWNVGISGINVQEIITRNCYLNIIFFAFSFFFLYKLLSLIKDDKWFVSIGLFFGFLSTGTISNTLLIREYALQEMFFTIFMYIFVLLYKKIALEKDYTILSIKNIIIYSVTTSLFMLSGYFSAILVVPAILTLLIITLIQKEYRNSLKILSIALLSIACLLIIYPPFFTNLFATGYYKDSSETIVQKIFDFKNYGYFLIVYLFFFSLYNGFYYILIKFLEFINIDIKDNKTLDKKELQLILITLFYTIFWLYIVSLCRLNISIWFPFHGRFMFPALPVFSVIFILIMYNWKKQTVNILGIIYLASAIFSIQGANVHWNGPVIFKNNFDFLDIQNKINFWGVSHGNKYNIVIYKPSYAYINNIMYLPDDTNVRFEDDINDSYSAFDKYFLITTDKNKIDTIKNVVECDEPYVWDTDYVCFIEKKY